MEFLKIHVELLWETKKSSSWQDSQDFAGRIERMLRLSMGVDLEATVDPDVEEPEEKEEEEKEKEGEEVEAEAEETSKGAAATETTEESKEDEVEVMENRNTGLFVLVTCQLYYFKLAYKLFMYI